MKFALAFALAHTPKLLLLDEPGGNFDHEFREEFLDILKGFVESGETTIILSTHSMEDVDRFADYLLLLHDGRQLLFGDIAAIRDDYRMVAGDKYKINLLKKRVIFMKETDFSVKALVKHSTVPYDPALKNRIPSAEELLYYMTNGAKQ